MTVKEANKWLEKVQEVIDNTQKIQKYCAENPDIWENFGESCDINLGFKEYTYRVIESLVAYKNLMKDKINNTKIGY